MLTTLFALALSGQSNAETPQDPDDPNAEAKMWGLTAKSVNAGNCNASNPAQVQLDWDWDGFSPAKHRFDVYLDSSLYGRATQPLRTNIFPSWLGGTMVGWFQDDTVPVGRLSLLRVVENGARNTFTTYHWTFRVQLVNIADGNVLQTLTVPWSKTYGTC